MTTPDASPTLGWGPSARFMPVNFVSAKKLWTCLATGSHECGRRLLWPCMIVVAVHHCDFHYSDFPLFRPSITVASHYCGRPSFWPPTNVADHHCALLSLWPTIIVASDYCGRPSLWPSTIVADHHCALPPFWPPTIAGRHFGCKS